MAVKRSHCPQVGDDVKEVGRRHQQRLAVLKLGVTPGRMGHHLGQQVQHRQKEVLHGSSACFRQTGRHFALQIVVNGVDRNHCESVHRERTVLTMSYTISF